MPPPVRGSNSFPKAAVLPLSHRSALRALPTCYDDDLSCYKKLLRMCINLRRGEKKEEKEKAVNKVILKFGLSGEGDSRFQKGSKRAVLCLKGTRDTATNSPPSGP